MEEVRQLESDVQALWDKPSALARVRNKEERLVFLVGLFLEDMPGRVVELGQAVKARDYEGACQLAHAIKGVAGNISGLQLFEAAGAFERGAKAQQNDLDSLYDELSSAHDVLCDILREYSQSMQAE